MILAVVSSALSIGLFAYWIARRVSAAHKEGQHLLAGLEATGNPFYAWPWLARVNRFATAFVPAIDRARAENRFGVADWFITTEASLTRAGLRQTLSPHQFFALSAASALALAALAVLVCLLFTAGPIVSLFVIASLGAVGAAIPAFILRRVVSDRVSFISKRLPFAVEFMLLAMEARAAFAGALEVYCDQARKEPLSDELRLVLHEVKLGLTVEEALRRFAGRVRIPDVTAFVVAVNTGLETGQPIKTILQIQADQCRQHRFDSAEQVAKAASTEAIFPLVLVAMTAMAMLIVPLLMRLTETMFF